MADRRLHRSRPPRWLRRSTTATVLAAGLALAQSVSAGTTGGAATAQAADVALSFDAPPIDLIGSSQSLAVGSNPGSQTVSGTLDFTDMETNSSLVATSTSIAVARTPSGIEATSSVDGLQINFRGVTVASATTLVASANCPVGQSTVTTEARANDVRLGDAAPVDLSSAQPASGSTTITDERGQAYTVELVASVFAGSEASSGEAGLRLKVTIDNEPLGAANLATVSCQRPDGGAEAPGPEEPDNGLAESGADTTVVAALLGIVLVAGGGSTLFLARSRRSPRTDPC